MSIPYRRDEVLRRIREACARSGRSPDEVGIIAVTKYVGVETAMSVLRAGLNNLGENRWQDAEPKWRASQAEETQPVWHFIGTLQSRKAKDVVGKFAYIHSLDRLSLAEAIDKRASQLGIRVPCFVQVNVSGEATKHGLQPDELIGFTRSVSAMTSIEIAGLMTMAPHEDDPELTRPVFRGLRELRDKLNEAAVLPYEVRGLSMGMSNDYEVAVEEGATWVRLGSILAGQEEAAL